MREAERQCRQPPRQIDQRVVESAEEDCRPYLGQRNRRRIVRRGVEIHRPRRCGQPFRRANERRDRFQRDTRPAPWWPTASTHPRDRTAASVVSTNKSAKRTASHARITSQSARRASREAGARNLTQGGARADGGRNVTRPPANTASSRRNGERPADAGDAQGNAGEESRRITDVSRNCPTNHPQPTTPARRVDRRCRRSRSRR